MDFGKITTGVLIGQLIYANSSEIMRRRVCRKIYLVKLFACEDGKLGDGDGQGVATYMQKCICIHIRTKNMGRFYHNSDGFLMLCVQNVCVEPKLISLNPIYTEFVRMFVSPPHRHPPINAK